MITQLRDMCLARQSAEVTMEDHQKPTAIEVMEMVYIAIAVVKGERNCRFVCQIFHGYLLGTLRCRYVLEYS